MQILNVLLITGELLVTLFFLTNVSKYTKGLPYKQNGCLKPDKQAYKNACKKSRYVIAASKVIEHSDCHPAQSGLTEVLSI